MKETGLHIKERPSMRLLVILPFGIALLLFIVFFTYTFYSNSLNMVLESEHEVIRLQSESITRIINTSMTNLPAITREWSSWDETYAFVNGEDPSYVEDKIDGYAPLRQHKLSFVVIKDMSGNDLCAKFYDYDKMQEMPMPDGLTDFLSPLGFEMLESYRHQADLDKDELIGRSGFMFFNNAAYYVSVLPVLTGSEDMPPAGMFFFGRVFENSEVTDIFGFEKTDVAVLDEIPPGTEEGSYDVIGSKAVIYKELPGFFRDTNVFLRVESPRDLYEGGIKSIAITAIIMIVLMTAFIVILVYLLDHNVLNPLERLSSDVRSVSDDSASINTVRHGGSRELFTLSSSIDAMLKKLAQSRLITEQSEDSINILKNVLNGIDAYLYVSDPVTDEILFINDLMREHFGLGDNGVGEVCWKVLQSGFDKRCDFCPINKLMENPEATVVWEENNTVTGHFYNNTDRIIEWTGGKKVHMQHSMDITLIKQAEADLIRRLAQQELMSSITQNFIMETDMDAAINNALQMTGQFMNVSRIMLSHYAADEGVLESKYIWCKDSRFEVAQNEHRVTFAEGGPVYDAVVTNGNPIVAVSDVEKDDAYNGKILTGVKAFLLIPVFVSGELWGVLVFDQFEGAYNWSESDIHLGNLIGNALSGVIIRQIMEGDKKAAEENILRAKEMAEEANKAKSEFLSRMSHEIRTPMNAIIGMTSIAKSTNDVEKKQHCLERIDNASKHLLNVINDILDMSKIEANKFELYSQEFDFEKMLINITNVINFKAEEKKQNLLINLDKDVPLSIIGDELRLSQVITNLLINAVKFTPESGTVILNVKKKGEAAGKITLQIEVVDNGIGISGEQQARLFTSFEQADGGISRKFGGTGLGLAISKRIVELMGGTIWIESELGRGAAFIFTMNVEEGKSMRKHRFYTGIEKKSIRILAVDDSVETRDYFLHVMDALNLSCDVAESGDEAIDMIDKRKDRPYNVFFIDWQMPDMNGIELARRIKEIVSDEAVIIMVSVAEWNDIESEATAAGVDHFIPKPLFPSTIVDSINKCLGAGRRIDLAAQKSMLKGKSDFKDHTLLLAEDVDVNREIMENLLEDTGATIDFAETGLEAFTLFKGNPGRYSLILMDIQMPEMDGYEAASKIRSLEYAEAKNIPIIAMTANVFTEDRERCLAAGMNDHVGKPIDSNELFTKLNLYLKSKAVMIMNDSTPKPNELENIKPSQVSDDYSEFLPDVDVLDGLNRLMKNKKLYITLLKNFIDKRMWEELLKNINDADFNKTAQTAHALRGVSANLGFVTLMGVLSNVEAQAKAEDDCSYMLPVLNEAVDKVLSVINTLLGKEGTK